MMRSRYENGILHLSSPVETLRIQWAGKPQALELTHSGKWRDCSPELRLLDPAHGKTAKADDAGAAALAAFRASIPAEIVQFVEPFATHQWNMMLFLHNSTAAMDLAVSNRVLAYALANNYEFRNTSVRPTLHCAMRNVRKKQREICSELGFPCADACARLFRKIPPESCSPAILRVLRKALVSDPSALEVLGHLKQLHPAVIYLISMKEVSKLVTAKLLMEVGAAGDSPGNLQVGGLLASLMQDVNDIGQPPQVPRFSSIRGIREFHERIVLELAVDRARREQMYRERIRQLEEERARFRERQAKAASRVSGLPEFPPPPLPGTTHIVPITSEAALKLEGREQHHCVGDYAYHVKNRYFYVYKVLRPDRATLSIKRGPGKAWRISDLKCACNAPAHAATRIAVEDWLAACNAAL